MADFSRNIADIREDYILAALDEQTAGSEPIAFFHKWFAEAEAARITEINAMTLATTDGRGFPHARIVLLKGLDETGFVFFTNYDSHKGKQLEANPHAALVFFWKELERQVRVEGLIEKVTPEESDAYFNSRPVGSKLGAWASPQSKIITDRSILDENYTYYQDKFINSDVPRPSNWGGYRIVPDLVEFWQGRASRMHDRIVFAHAGEGKWAKTRLAP